MSEREPSAVRFSNEAKLRKQMVRRGWTERQIIEALATPAIPALGQQGPARRHVHPETGQSLVVDLATGEIFHLGKKGYHYE